MNARFLFIFNAHLRFFFLCKERSSSANESKEEHNVTQGPQLSTSTSSLSSDKQQINIGKDAAMEAETRAARERAVVPLETRINSFKEMLAEKEVNFFTFFFRFLL